MLDLLRNSPAVGLEALEILVLDEAREGAERQPERRISGDLGRSQQADRLLDLGFRAEVEEVVRMCPPERQTLLFSATISAEVAELANASLREPLQALPLSAPPRFSPPLSASPAPPLPFRLPSLPRTRQRAETCPRPRDVPPPYPPQVKVDALYGVAERLAQEFVRIKPGKEHEREAPLPSLAPTLARPLPSLARVPSQ